MHFQYIYIPYVWLLLASAAVSAALGIHAWRQRAVPGATPFAVLMLLAVVWSLTNALEMAASSRLRMASSISRRAALVCWWNSSGKRGDRFL